MADLVAHVLQRCVTRREALPPPLRCPVRELLATDPLRSRLAWP